MCAADDEGNMVSLIQSNYRGMGSGIVVPGLGFIFMTGASFFRWSRDTQMFTRRENGHFTRLFQDL